MRVPLEECSPRLGVVLAAMHVHMGKHKLRKACPTAAIAMLEHLRMQQLGTLFVRSAQKALGKILAGRLRVCHVS